MPEWQKETIRLAPGQIADMRGTIEVRSGLRRQTFEARTQVELLEIRDGKAVLTIRVMELEPR